MKKKSFARDIYCEQQDGCFVVKSRNGVILVDELDEESAKELCLRVNSHASLIEALENIVKAAVKHEPLGGMIMEEAIQVAGIALALAGGKEEG